MLACTLGIAGYVFPVLNGTFARISNSTYTRYSMSVQGLPRYALTVVVLLVRVPYDAPEPQALNASLTVPYAPPRGR